MKQLASLLVRELKAQEEVVLYFDYFLHALDFFLFFVFAFTVECVFLLLCAHALDTLTSHYDLLHSLTHLFVVSLMPFPLPVNLIIRTL